MKRYSVTKIAGEMVVTPNRGGDYRASTAEEIKRALSEPKYRPPNSEVLIGNTWYPLRRGIRSLLRRIPRQGKRRYSTPEPIKPMPLHLRMLKRLHLYRDPLEALIYRGENNN